MIQATFVLSTLGASAVTAAVLTPVVSWAARSLGLLDAPGVRKVHAHPTPRIGGVGIAVAVLGPLAVILLVLRPDILAGAPVGVTGELATLIGGAVTLLAVGLIDDVWQVSAKWKLLALVLASAALCASGGAIHSVLIGGRQIFKLGPAAWPVTMLWLAGVTVSINFIDGLDGLAAGIVAAAAGVLAIGAHAGGAPIAVVLALCLAGALLGFLVHNHHPARTFMGDCGSMFIGYLLAGTCVLAATSIGSTTKGILLPAVALVVPLFDTFFTMVRRGVLQRRSLFAAEGGHIHHRLLDVGLRHNHVVLLLHGVTLVASGVAVECILGSPWAAALSAIVLFVALFGLFKTAGTVRARETLTAIRRNRAIGRETRRYQNAFYDLQLHFRKARTLDDWWVHLCRAADVLDFGKLNLTLGRRDGTSHVMRWRRPRRDDDPMSAADSITADVPVPQRRIGTTVRAEVEVLASEFLETGGLRVALFSRLMADCGLDRLPITPRAGETVADAEITTDPVLPAVAVDGPFAGLRVAIVHDFLYTYGGAERVVEQLLAVFPQADIFALFDFLPAESRGFLGGRPVTPSFLQKMPGARRRHRWFLPLMPLAVEQLDVSAYDLIVSSSYVAAKGVITRPDQLHVCYCHTPVRFAWDLQGQYLRQTGLAGGILSFPAKVLLHYIRGWDVRSAHGVDVFLTNSDFVGRRIAKTYRRPATTVYPPVDTTAFALNDGPREDFYLTASRLVPYKRIDLIIAAFNQMPTRRLIVIGDGPELNELRELAGPNVTVMGHASAERLRRQMQLARAFVFAAEEDFGIAPVEAQACGTPVIAFGRGGATETVKAGVTGVFFDEQTPAALIAAVERFEQMEFDPHAARANAELFSPDVFCRHITDQVRDHWAAFKDRTLSPGPVPLGGHRGEPGDDAPPDSRLADVSTVAVPRRRWLRARHSNEGRRAEPVWKPIHGCRNGVLTPAQIPRAIGRNGIAPSGVAGDYHRRIWPSVSPRCTCPGSVGRHRPRAVDRPPVKPRALPSGPTAARWASFREPFHRTRPGRRNCRGRITAADMVPPATASLALLTDLYQLTMAYGYWKVGRADRSAVFHMTFRTLPFAGGYAIAAGLGPAIDFIEAFRFDSSDLAYLATLIGNDGRPLFELAFLDYLGNLNLTLDVDAMPEGTAAFAHEPLLRVRGPMLQCQLLETPLLTILNFQTLVATKAARVCGAARGDPVLEFGLRRAQGIDGGLAASRAAYVGGVHATSNVLAGKRFGIPVRGTHAHSWVMSFDDELEAFEAYASALPNNCVFLVDTYDTLQGVRHAATIGQQLKANGHKMVGIRLDSGDLAYLSIEARKILDGAGLPDAAILASNDLDERLIESLKQQGATIAVWGVGTKLVTAYDQPALGGVYKLGAIQGDDGRWHHKLKLSEQTAKVSTPGVQQVRRYYHPDGTADGDAIVDELAGAPPAPLTIVDPADPGRRKTFPTTARHDDLLLPVFRGGRRVYDLPPLAASRQRTADQLALFHATTKRLVNPHPYPVGLERSLHETKLRLIAEARAGTQRS